MMPSAKLAFVALFGTLAYLGLAIRGSGGVAAFFMQPALTALAITALVLTGISLFSGGNLSSGEREDRRTAGSLSRLALWGC